MICCDETWLDLGVECDSTAAVAEARHFVCNQCLDQYIVSLHANTPPAVLSQWQGRIQCPGFKCESTGFQLIDLFDHLSGHGNQILVELVGKVKEYLAIKQNDQVWQRKLELERKKGDLERHRRFIQEDILNLRCPRCNQVFVDFNGCFALTCSRCKAGFCGWCLADCGRDAHRHVANCRLNQNPDRNVFQTCSDSPAADIDSIPVVFVVDGLF